MPASPPLAFNPLPKKKPKNILFGWVEGERGAGGGGGGGGGGGLGTRLANTRINAFLAEPFPFLERGKGSGTEP